MFLNKIVTRNKIFVETAFELHQKGMISPDSYLIDYDQFIKNSMLIKEEADKYNIKLFFMLKQLGRNPYLAKQLMRLGYNGAVVVDFREAQIMMKHNIPLGNVGHLVQIPKNLIEIVINYGTEVITVYSLDIVRNINKFAEKLGKVQKILLRITNKGDRIYNGQAAGFLLNELDDILNEIHNYSYVKVSGITSFPCYLFDETKNAILETDNVMTIKAAVSQLKNRRMDPEVIDLPSCTCVKAMNLIHRDGGNYAEPGHGLTGTTPAHSIIDLEEIPSVLYISEVSHNFDDKAYCYGGGFYRRSLLKFGLVGKTLNNSKILHVNPPSMESIDYHFELENNAVVGNTVLMAFRFQIFVTRSDVVILKGISDGKPEIIGIYDSLGNDKWIKNS